MAAKRMRSIIHIDQEKCNGCGPCVTSCAEGATLLAPDRTRLHEVYQASMDKYPDSCPESVRA